MGAKVHSLPREWREFFCCALMLLLLPCLPLVAEWLFSPNGVDERSVFMFISMYSIGIGITSRNVFYFAVSVIVCLVYCVAYGALVAKSPHAYACAGLTAKLVIGFMVLWHLLERYDRHVSSQEPFFEFADKA